MKYSFLMRLQFRLYQLTSVVLREAIFESRHAILRKNLTIFGRSLADRPGRLQPVQAQSAFTQARPSTIGPASISRATLKSAKSMTTTLPLALQET